MSAPGGALSSLAARGGRSPGEPVLVYRLIADDLRQRILSGRRGPGEQIPPGRILRERYQVADMTVRSAGRVPQDEGLVHTMHGLGSFVADPLPAPPATAPDGAHPNEADPAPGMPTREFIELSRRIQEIADGQARLLAALRQAGNPPTTCGGGCADCRSRTRRPRGSVDGTGRTAPGGGSPNSKPSSPASGRTERTRPRPWRAGTSLARPTLCPRAQGDRRARHR
ncbi:GntR family transcriptional regulator [Streptomyces sp. NPDC005407]|uniref:GntR family transcriptional regulator n=1 Tax=Streptomyces sp. NPDC005407 TaxID=3155340 RepID=UPI0033BD90B7